MPPTQGSPLRLLLFRISLVLKGLDGALEMAGGVVLFFFGPGRIVHLVRLLTQNEFAQSDHPVATAHLRHAARHLSSGSEHFAALYLLAHGLVKVGLVIALLRNRRWAYPTALAIFGAFVAYQLYRFALSHSIGLVVLSLFDLIVMFFIWLEYRSIKSSAPASANSAE